MNERNFLMNPLKTKTNNPVRKGRGIGSGKGKTAGRGHKGQLARSGRAKTPFIATSDTPLQRRLPRRGFKSLLKDSVLSLPLDQFLEMSVAVSGSKSFSGKDLSIDYISSIDRSFYGTRKVKVFMSKNSDFEKKSVYSNISVSDDFVFSESCKKVVSDLGFKFVK